MKLVLDASVALKWVLQEPDVQKALDLREDFRNGIHELLAPDIFVAEVAEVLSKMVRMPQPKLTQLQAEAYLGEIMTTPPDLYSIHPLMARAYELSLQFRKGLYDCLYIALAEHENCSVVTVDSGMVINHRSSQVILLQNLP